jgi:predicted peptidase
MPLISNTSGAIDRTRLAEYVAASEKVTAVAITDAAEPTAAQLLNSKLFVGTPTVDTTFTLPTAALVLAALTDEAVGTSFEFTIVNLASAYQYTVTTATGWTITNGGNMVVFDGTSATFLAVVTSDSAIQLYRKNSGGAVK